MKEEKFPNTRKPSHGQVCGEFWNLRGKHNREEENKQTNKQTNKPQTKCLTTTPIREVAQTLANGKWGLNREAQDTLLRARTGPGLNALRTI